MQYVLHSKRRAFLPPAYAIRRYDLYRNFGELRKGAPHGKAGRCGEDNFFFLVRTMKRPGDIAHARLLYSQYKTDLFRNCAGPD